MRRTTFFLMVSLQLSFVLISCGGASDDFNVAFKVVETSPANGEKDVPPSAMVLITFSSSGDIDTTSVTSQTIVMADSMGNSVPGTISCQGITINFTPKYTLDALTKYIFTVKSELKDTTGKTLGSGLHLQLYHELGSTT